MTTWIALLRGVNVTNRRVGMAEVCEMVDSTGARNVRTHLQSGNVVVEDDRSAAELEASLTAVLAAGTGLDIPVVLRDAAQLRSIVAANPFPAGGPTTLHVVFLSVPSAPIDLDPDEFLPEQFHLAGSDLYLLLPGGMGRSRLATALSRRGGPSAVGTSRNWRTVTALDTLASGPVASDTGD